MIVSFACTEGHRLKHSPDMSLVLANRTDRGSPAGWGSERWASSEFLSEVQSLMLPRTLRRFLTAFFSRRCLLGQPCPEGHQRGRLTTLYANGTQCIVSQRSRAWAFARIRGGRLQVIGHLWGCIPCGLSRSQSDPAHFDCPALHSLIQELCVDDTAFDHNAETR